MDGKEFELEATLESVQQQRKKPARLVFHCDVLGSSDYADLARIASEGARVILDILPQEPPLPGVTEHARQPKRKGA